VTPDRPVPPSGPLQRLTGDVLGWAWRRVQRAGTVVAGSREAARFAQFGEQSTIAFPPTVLHGVDRIEIGSKTMIGPHATLSVGMLVPMDTGTDPVLSIGDRCILGKGVSIVAHERIEIGDDTVAGHYVYVTDQNHSYRDVDLPIGRQMWKNAPVQIGSSCWLGHGAIVVPGVTIGRHVVVAAGSVVTRDVPDFCVVAGAPARIVRRYVEERGWVAPSDDGTPRFE
jgi:acetyltransferase-like isoleucine patch superfamily enzyme